MLSQKAKSITPSVTLGISTKVKEMKAEGIKVSNLSVGEPDFFTPEKAKEAGIEAIQLNKTKYDAAAGLKELRIATAKKLKVENGVDYDFDNIVISSGAKHAITNALIAVIDPGDEVIIPKPYWVSYPEMVKLTGGVPVFVDTQFENSFKLTVEELKSAVTDKTKVIFITNPSNPTGAVYTKDELESIANFCLKNNIIIFADEIYERICFKNNFTSVASLSDEIKDITVIINGMSKSAAMTGWRIGYTATNKKIAKAIGAIQGHLVSHPSTISQYTALKALEECSADIDAMVETYTKRRNECIDIFSKIDELSIVEPDGAFYIFINISKLREKVQPKESLSLEVCDSLLNDFKVAFVPGIAFGLDDYLRMSYATDMDTIKEGISKLESYIKSL